MGLLSPVGSGRRTGVPAQPLMGPLRRGRDKPGLSDPTLCPGVTSQPCCLPRPLLPWPPVPAWAGEVLLQGHRHGPEQHLAPDEARLSRHLLDPLHDLLPHPRHPHVGRGLHLPQRVHQTPLFATSENRLVVESQLGARRPVPRVSVHPCRPPAHRHSHRCAPCNSRPILLARTQRPSLPHSSLLTEP